MNMKQRFFSLTTITFFLVFFFTGNLTVAAEVPVNNDASDPGSSRPVSVLQRIREDYQRKKEADLLGHPAVYYSELEASFIPESGTDEVMGLNLGIGYKRLLLTYRSHRWNQLLEPVNNTMYGIAFRRRINRVIGFGLGIGSFKTESATETVSGASLFNQISIFPTHITGLVAQSNFVFLRQNIIKDIQVGLKVKLRYAGMNIGYKLYSYRETVSTPFIAFSVTF